MNRLIATILALWLSLAYCVSLAEAREWDDTEKALGVAALTLHAIDWGQTRHIAMTPGFYETNPLLPRHPSIGQVNQHFLISGLAIAGLAHFIPSWRKTLLSVYVGGQVANVTRNFHIGLRVSF